MPGWPALLVELSSIVSQHCSVLNRKFDYPFEPYKLYYDIFEILRNELIILPIQGGLSDMH